jgi:hypothetical protein
MDETDDGEALMLRTDEEHRPCVGCGYCCIRQTCTFGIQRHPDAVGRICPELEWNGKRYLCRAMKAPGTMTTFYRELLQAGLGCRSYLNPWRKEVKVRTKADLPKIDE